MAHTKAGGSKAVQGGNVSGKRLGVKVYGGSNVKNGQIILRQRGREIIPGNNVGMGKDFTIYSKTDGVVDFSWKTKNRKKVSVLPKKEGKKID